MQNQIRSGEKEMLLSGKHRQDFPPFILSSRFLCASKVAVRLEITFSTQARIICTRSENSYIQANRSLATSRTAKAYRYCSHAELPVIIRQPRSCPFRVHLFTSQIYEDLTRNNDVRIMRCVVQHCLFFSLLIKSPSFLCFQRNWLSMCRLDLHENSRRALIRKS
jgi:hypothetical protein